MTTRTSVKTTSRLKVVGTDATIGLLDNPKSGAILGMRIERMISALASEPPKTLTLNRKRDMDNVTPTETARSTNPEMSSDVIDLWIDNKLAINQVINQNLFGTIPIFLSSQEAYTSSSTQSRVEY